MASPQHLRRFGRYLRVEKASSELSSSSELDTKRSSAEVMELDSSRIE